MEKYRLLPSEADLVDTAVFELNSAGDYVDAVRMSVELDESKRETPGLALRVKSRQDLRRALEISGTRDHVAQVKTGGTSSGNFNAAAADAWLKSVGKRGLSLIKIVEGDEFSRIHIDSGSETVTVGPAVNFDQLRSLVPSAWSLTTNGAGVTATLQNTGGVADGGEGTHSDFLAGSWMDSSGVEHFEASNGPVPYHEHRLPGEIRRGRMIFDSAGRGGAFGVSLDTTLPLPRQAVRRSFVLVYPGSERRSSREAAHRSMLSDAIAMNKAAMEMGSLLKFRFGGMEAMDFRAMDVARRSGSIFNFPRGTYSAVVVHTYDYRSSGANEDDLDFLERMDRNGLLPQGLMTGESFCEFLDIDDLNSLELFRLAGPDEARKLIGARVDRVGGRDVVLSHAMSTDPGLNAVDGDQVMSFGMDLFNAQEDLLIADPHAKPVMYAHLTGEQKSPRVTIHGRVAVADKEAFQAYQSRYYNLMAWWQNERIISQRAFREFAEKPFNPFKDMQRILMARGMTPLQVERNQALMRKMDPDGLFLARQVERWPGFADLVAEHSVSASMAAK